MAERIMQHCYTNIVREQNGKITSGWESVAVSPDLPPEAVETCSKLQNINSSIQGNPQEESGAPLNLFEIVGDGRYLYVMRSRYDAYDRENRKNMFSHAFIFPATAEIVSDPNWFLTVADENFKSTEEEANPGTMQIVRTAPFDLQDCLERCNIDADKYRVLLSCLYTEISEQAKTRKPLFVQYDGSMEMLRACLYCIYMGIPFSARRTLSVASAPTKNNTTTRNIVFSVRAKEMAAASFGAYYIDPGTGETNANLKRMERKVSRLGYVDFVARNLGGIRPTEYFRNLEAKAVEIGDPTASNELTLKIAHQLVTEGDITERTEDNVVDRRLSDAIGSDSVGNKAIDRYICSLLREYLRRGLKLSPENDKTLMDRVNSGVIEELEKASEDYHLYWFSQQPVEEAAKSLAGMSDNIADLYHKRLMEDARGREILDQYYADKALGEDGRSWNGLREVLAGSARLVKRPRTEKAAYLAAMRLYGREMEEQIRRTNPTFAETFGSYQDILNQVMPAERAEEIIRKAKDEFWEQMQFENVSFRATEQYKRIAPADKSVFFERCKYIVLLSGLPHDLEEKGEGAFLDKTANYFITFQDKTKTYRYLGQEDVESARKRLRNYLEQQNAPGEQLDWVKIFSQLVNSRQRVALTELYRELQGNDADEICRSYEKTVELLTDEQTKPLLKNIAGLVLPACRKLDRESRPVSLDMWLAIGLQTEDNCFDIFEDGEPACILDVDAADVVAKSRYLKKGKILDQASDYVDSKGLEAKTVKKWMQAVKKIQKEAGKQPRKAEESSSGRGREDASRSSKNEDDGRGEGGGKSGRSDTGKEAKEKKKTGFFKWK